MTTESATNAPTDKQVQILIIDDSADLRESLRFALEDTGWPILEASNGVTGLEILQATPHSCVVLLDQVMPELDGLGVLEAITREPGLASRHAFILFTASARVTEVQQQLCAIAATSVPLIRKPFDLDVLLDEIQKAADRLSVRMPPDAGS